MDHFNFRDTFNNVFVIGNGFDLDLGIKTKYSDFANSSYWPITDSNLNSNGLNNYLYKYKNNLADIEKINWFDLEKTLLDYAISINSDTLDFGFVEQDRKCFLDLESKFSDYLKYEQANFKNEILSRTSVEVLKLIRKNGFFSKVYSFNYTDFSSLSQRYAKYTPQNLLNIHGSLANDSIILGINDKIKIPQCYRFLIKSRSEFYQSNNLVEDLLTADECVFFGLSFGIIDSIYFERFFKDVVDNSKGSSSTKKKNITIFTYDEDSRISIMDNLTDMDISISELYACSNFSIIKTKNISAQYENDKFNAFKDRLEANRNPGFTIVDLKK